MMTIGEAGDIVKILRFAAGEPTGLTPEQLRGTVDRLRDRAGKALQVRVDVDEHGLDRAIAERLERGAL